MNLKAYYCRSSKWEKHPDVFKSIERGRARPRKTYVLEISNLEDVEKARKAGVPVLKIDSRDMSVLGYPMSIPTTVVVPREFETAIRTRFRVRTFQSLSPFIRRRIEDIFVLVLSFDLIAARAILQRNADLFDLGYLQKRIMQEDLEEEATKIRFQEFASVPVVGRPLPRKAMDRAARGNLVRGVIP